VAAADAAPQSAPAAESATEALPALAEAGDTSRAGEKPAGPPVAFSPAALPTEVSQDKASLVPPEGGVTDSAGEKPTGAPIAYLPVAPPVGVPEENAADVEEADVVISAPVGNESHEDLENKIQDAAGAAAAQETLAALEASPAATTEPAPVDVRAE